MEGTKTQTYIVGLGTGPRLLGTEGLQLPRQARPGFGWREHGVSHKPPSARGLAPR